MNISTKIGLALLITAGFSTGIHAQSEKAHSVTKSVNSYSLAAKNTPVPQVLAAFDEQFSINMTTVNPVQGFAAAIWTGTEFWVSKWASDSLFTLDITGNLTSSFTIPGVTGVRGLTTDGTLLYAGKNTTSISIIDPATKTVTGSITAPLAVRGITYDASADGGNGGLWVSNFDTDITLITLTGTSLTSIPAGNHGLTAMYGIAYDPYSANGPFIWAFNQGGAHTTDFVKIDIASMTPVFTYDAFTDVGVTHGVTGSLAGGIFITNDLVTGENTIGGLIQGTPNVLFGLELDEPVILSENGSLDTLIFNPPFTVFPDFQAAPITFTGMVRNIGSNMLTTLNMDVEITDATSANVYSGSGSISNFAPGASSTVTASPAASLSIQGVYDVTAVIDAGAQTDLDNSNDSLLMTLVVSDTVMAREDGISTGSLGIGNGTGGTLGQNFTLTSQALVTSITMQLNNPTAGDITDVAVFATSGGVPLSVIGGSGTYTITASDTSGVVLTLPLTTPLNLSPGTYFVGVNENTSNITLATTTFNFRPNSAYATFGATPFTPIESLGFPRTFLLRLNMQVPSGLTENTPKMNLNVYPNPANNFITVDFSNVKSGISELVVFDASGKSVYTASDISASQYRISLAGLAKGLYVLRTTADDGSVSAGKFTID